LEPSPNEQPLSRIGLHHEAAATPDRVRAAMEALVSATRAAAGSELVEGLTVTVSNRTMTVNVNAWTPESKAAVDVVHGFIDDPIGASDRLEYGVAARMAKALRTGLELLMPAGTVEIGGPAGTLRTVTQPLVEALRGLERLHEPQTELRGSTVTSTVVLQVGRGAKSPEKWFAKVRLYGQLYEVPLMPETLGTLVRALERGDEVEVRVDATWVRGDAGQWVLDPRRSRIICAAESAHAPLAPGDWSAMPGALTAEAGRRMLQENAAWDE
jgi:hypothetical protein